MNSFVSVEDEEVICCDGLDNLVLSASISGSSLDLESDYESGNSINVSLDSTEGAADFPGFSVDLNCLPILLDNDAISFDDDILVSEIGLDKLFLSDTDSNDSFDGFTESSASSFEGFVQKHNQLLLNKLNILSDNSDNSRPSPNQIKDKTCRPRHNLILPQKYKRKKCHVSKIKYRSKRRRLLKLKELKLGLLSRRKNPSGRPRKHLLTVPKQNNSKSFNNSFHHSSPKNPTKEINGTNQFGKHEREGEKKILLKSRPSFSNEETKTINATPTRPRPNIKSESTNEKVFNLSSPRASLYSNPDTEMSLASLSGSTNNLYRSSSEESFEGFHENNINASNDFLEPISTKPDNNVNKYKAQESDFIGIHCNSINCTIAWLESAECNKNPVPVNNGVVFELHQFAKKINWESHYVAIWILRLRGYEKVSISDDDLKKINLIVRRRKAITINFAGSHSYKSKLSAFDKDLFSLPTAEKLDAQKFTKFENKISVVNDNESNNLNLGRVTKKEREKLLVADDELKQKCILYKKVEKPSRHMPIPNSFSKEQKIVSSEININIPNSFDESKFQNKTLIEGDKPVIKGNIPVPDSISKELNIEQLELKSIPTDTSSPFHSGRFRGRPKNLVVPEQNNSKDFDNNFHHSSSKNSTEEINSLSLSYSNNPLKEKNKVGLLNIKQVELKPISASSPFLSVRPRKKYKRNKNFCFNDNRAGNKKARELRELRRLAGIKDPRGRPRKYPIIVPELNNSKGFDSNLNYSSPKNHTEDINKLPLSFSNSRSILTESKKEFDIGIRKRSRHQSDPILRITSNINSTTINKGLGLVTENTSPKPKLFKLPEKEKELNDRTLRPAMKIKDISHEVSISSKPQLTNTESLERIKKITEVPEATNNSISVPTSNEEISTSIEKKNLSLSPIFVPNREQQISSLNKSSSYCAVDSFAVSSKGRIRKPTVKIQDLFCAKQCKLTNIAIESSFSNQNISATKLFDKTSTVNEDSFKSMKKVSLFPVKPTPNIFKDEICVIGNHCQEASIDVKLLNSNDKATKPITNGVVYELYHFFKKRNAKLTSLVHTIYRLKGLAIEKAPIISTMAKIHELVKVVWEEQVKIDPSMPYKEFEMGNASKFVASYPQPSIKDDESKDVKKGKNDASTNKEFVTDSSCLASKNDSDLSSFDSNIISKIDDNIFDLNVTKGQEGNITKGDIVYVYTSWLKKKMEGQCKVFVTDLSKDVEDLITARKVGTIRIPVGTLMSSSVKLFEEFRRLSKINMQDAKNYLLEDWIPHIQSLLKPINSKKIFNPEDANANKNLSSTNADSEQEDLSTTIEEHQEISRKSSSDSEDSELILAPVKIGLSTKGKPRKSKIIDWAARKEKPTCVEKNKMEVVNNNNETNIATDIHKTKQNKPKIGDDYEVEKIVGYRIVKIGLESITEYRVRWVGFSPVEDSWVNVADLQCPDRLSEFWDALKKQRAMKKQGNATNEFTDEHRSLLSGQENVPPFIEREPVISQPFLNLLIKNLKPILIDYQYDEEGSIPKRVRVSKGDILNIFDKWRQENKEKLLTGANRPLAVNILISRVKTFMDSKKVRNFNPNCLIDTCFRMSLMKEKLKDPSKVKEYLSGDFMELFESSRRHQESVRSENANQLKIHKNDKLSTEFNPHNEIDDKQRHISKIEKESFLIAKYINKHGLNTNLTDTLKGDIASLKKGLDFGTADEGYSGSNIEALKIKNKTLVQEIKECGLKENKLDELIKLALKST